MSHIDNVGQNISKKDKELVSGEKVKLVQNNDKFSGNNGETSKSEQLLDWLDGGEDGLFMDEESRMNPKGDDSPTNKRANKIPSKNNNPITNTEGIIYIKM